MIEISLFHFFVLGLYTVVCVVVTYLNSRKLTNVMKQRDKLALSGIELYVKAKQFLPEDIAELRAMKNALVEMALAEGLRTEKKQDST